MESCKCLEGCFENGYSSLAEELKKLKEQQLADKQELKELRDQQKRDKMELAELKEKLQQASKLLLQ